MLYKYKNPENTDSIINKLKEQKTITDVNILIKETFPDWIIGYMDSFCVDYPHLDNNWSVLCDKMGVLKAQIIIVEVCEPQDGKDFSLLNIFTECLTRAGFVVRSKWQFVPCSTCGCAVPTEEIYDFLKEKKIKTPENWSSKCSTC